jgi:hypothetical protein
VGFHYPFGEKPLAGMIKVPYLSAFATYHHNPDADDDDDAWIAGAAIGHKKVSKPKTWQLKYQYRRLEQDAWLDIFPDSDTYGGATNVKGSEVIFNYALFKNVILGIDYYHNEPINENALGRRNDEDLLQVDMVYKF